MKTCNRDQFLDLLDRISRGLVALYLALLCSNLVCLSRRTLQTLACLGAFARNQADSGCICRAAGPVRDVCALLLCAEAIGGESFAPVCESILADCRAMLAFIRSAEGPQGAFCMNCCSPEGPVGFAAENAEHESTIQPVRNAVHSVS
ncbi:MAG TPA: hypothetical protein VMW73_13720 [Spirochaetia bacterium]|nr:hypothetical protein [Spirochaetia bacterium]